MPWGTNKDDELLKTIKELFEKQTEVVQANTAQVAQLSQQMTQLSTQQEAMRNDFNARWADLPKLYVPRQEHQAMGLDTRVVALEEFRIAATKDISDLKLNVQQQVQTVVHDIQDKVSTQRETIDARTISFWFSIALLLINFVWTIVSHFIIK